jgi:tRNA A-37 threonylcarbamoyl transferase component Bud32
MDSRQLEECLSAFVERRERGEALAPEAFAAEHAGAGPELLAALRALVAAEALFPTSTNDRPARIGRFRILGEIGRGGMGRVFQAVDPERPATPLALKLLHVSLEQEPRALERFRREGQALERLRHPGIVHVLEAGLVDERPYLAMERVEGTGLGKLLARARDLRTSDPRATLELPGEGTPLERAVRLVARLSRALEAAHREGVLHRDLNPRNVLVRPDGTPVVIDFGLVHASGEPTLTGSGDLLGTPQYMASEQARGERVDERTDVFGLGVILLELLTLEPPRVGADTLALVRQASTQPLGSLARRVPGLPRELVTVLWRATAHLARWRYPSCAALAADLERWLEGEPIRARPPAPWTRALEFAVGHRRATLTSGVLALVAAAAFLARHGYQAEGRHARLVEATNAVVQPWFEGDLARARAALDDYRHGAEPPLFASFLAFLTGAEGTPAPADPAERALFAGERARRAGHAAEALAHFRSAWDLAPDFPMTLLLEGLAALDAHELEAARHVLQRSVRPFGNSPRLHRTLAEVYQRLELWGDAGRALHAVTTLAPEDSAAWAALARVRVRAGAEDGALEAARRACALDPTLCVSLADDWRAEGRAGLAERLAAASR